VIRIDFLFINSNKLVFQMKMTLQKLMHCIVAGRSWLQFVSSLFSVWSIYVSLPPCSSNI